MVGVAIQQHVPLHRAANVLAAHRITHVERLQQRKLRDEIQCLVVLRQYVGSLDAAGDRVAAAGQTVRGEERFTVGMLLSDNACQMPM